MFSSSFLQAVASTVVMVTGATAAASVAPAVTAVAAAVMTAAASVALAAAAAAAAATGINKDYKNSDVTEGNYESFASSICKMCWGGGVRGSNLL